MAKRDLTRIAHDQIDAEDRDDVDDREAQDKEWISWEDKGRNGAKRQDGSRPEPAAPFPGWRDHARLRSATPKIPCGLMHRTANNTPKAMTSFIELAT